MRIHRLLQPELLICLAAVAARLIPGPRTIDDAYITFRYAQNLLRGDGLVYNPGQMVLGTTTPVYALLMAGLSALSGGTQAPFPLLALIVNALADGLTCWLIVRLAGLFAARRAGIAAALVWALAPMSVTFAIGGMETSLFIALATATFYFHSRDRPVAAALCGAFTLLTRPDALLLLVPLAVERLRRSLPQGRLNRVPHPVTGREALAFALPVGVWIVLGSLTYGSPLPHSILAKAAAYRLPPEAALIRLVQHYATPFLEHLAVGTWWVAVGMILYPLLFGIGALWLLRKQPGAWPLLVYPWAYLLAFAIANPLLFRWYLAPPLPLYILGIFLGFERLGRDLRLPAVPLAAGALAVALTLNGWTLHPDHGPDRPAPEMAFIKLELLYEQVADDLRAEIQPGEVLAAGDVGALGYFTGAEILDTVGLISPQSTAYYPIPESLYVINYAIPPQLVEDLRPDYLVMLEVYGRNGLLVDAGFQADYLLIETIPTDLYESAGMLVFRRRD